LEVQICYNYTNIHLIFFSEMYKFSIWIAKYWKFNTRFLVSIFLQKLKNLTNTINATFFFLLLKFIFWINWIFNRKITPNVISDSITVFQHSNPQWLMTRARICIVVYVTRWFTYKIGISVSDSQTVKQVVSTPAVSAYSTILWWPR
jgi:hypothetical protein